MDIFDFDQFKRLLERNLTKDQASVELAQLSALCTLFGASERELPEHLKCFSPLAQLWDQLVLFPGSFSPWHKGHEACVQGCGPFPVLIIPDANPWKDGRETDVWEDFKSIYEYVRKSTKENLYIYPGFLTKERSNPTVTWLPQLPLKKKRLLMGDDTFLSIHRWREAQKLLSSLDEIYVCPRQGEMEELTKQFDFLTLHYELNIFFLEAHDYQDVSSTGLRNGQNLK